jgi:hypothetical protein
VNKHEQRLAEIEREVKAKRMSLGSALAWAFMAGLEYAREHEPIEPQKD